MENAVQGLGENVNMKIRWSLIKNHWKGRKTEKLKTLFIPEGVELIRLLA